jgi:hypothetical protein
MLASKCYSATLCTYPRVKLMNFERLEDVIATVNSLANPASSVVGRQELAEHAVAEYLRYGLCLLANSGKDGRAETRPVHIGRLLGRVRKQLGPLLPKTGKQPLEDLVPIHAPYASRSEDTCRRIFNKLELIRDVQNLGRGYFLPTPLRLLELPSGDVLVIGAVPTLAAQKVLGTKLRSAGLARVSEIGTLPIALKNNSDAWQSLRNWLGIESSLENWIEKYLAAALKDLRASSSEIGAFEVYFPERMEKKPHHFRWCEGKSWAGRSDRLYLCRSADKNRGRSYWLGLLARDQDIVRMVKETELESNKDIIRLLYGFDLLAKVPVTAEIEADATGGRLQLSSLLPKEERRLLVALAVDTSPAPDKLPLTFRFENRWREDIERNLSSLGIELRGQSSPWR